MCCGGARRSSARCAIVNTHAAKAALVAAEIVEVVEDAKEHLAREVFGIVGAAEPQVPVHAAGEGLVERSAVGGSAGACAEEHEGEAVVGLLPGLPDGNRSETVICSLSDARVTVTTSDELGHHSHQEICPAVPNGNPAAGVRHAGAEKGWETGAGGDMGGVCLPQPIQLRRGSRGNSGIGSRRNAPEWGGVRGPEKQAPQRSLLRLCSHSDVVTAV